MRSLLLVILCAACACTASAQRDDYPQREKIAVQTHGGQSVIAPDTVMRVTGQTFTDRVYQGSLVEFIASTGGVTVMVNGESAALRYVSPDQIQFVSPSFVASSGTKIRVTVASTLGTWSALVPAAMTAPHLFIANETSADQWAAGFWRYPDGMPQFIGSSVIGAGAQPVEIVLHGTGFRHAESVRVFIGSESFPARQIGPYGIFRGFDYVAFTLPAGFAQTGTTLCRIVADGVHSNDVWLAFP